MPCDRAQMDGFLLGESEQEKGKGRDRPLGRGVAEEKKRETDRWTETEGEMRGGQGPFKREHSECVQVVFSVATAEDLYAKVRPVQMTEY